MTLSLASGYVLISHSNDTLFTLRNYCKSEIKMLGVIFFKCTHKGAREGEKKWIGMQIAEFYVCFQLIHNLNRNLKVTSNSENSIKARDNFMIIA